jgi:hypothetical protein
MAATEFVFGYGALVFDLCEVPARSPDREGFVTHLDGVRRAWNVAMDNRFDLPGYKYYLAPDGSRPSVFVAFLDVVPSPGGSVNGLCRPVAEEELPVLDRRERNYARVEVTGRIDGPPGRTWIYVGSPAARERLRHGSEAGSAVVTREYLDRVVRGFEALGPDELRGFEATTVPHPFPVLDLERIDLPEG